MSFPTNAQNLINSVKGHNYTLVELAPKAIELAKMLLTQAASLQTYSERKRQTQLAHLMDDPKGKEFSTAMTDQAFRSSSPQRAVDQLMFLLRRYGIPSFLPLTKRLGLHLFKLLGKQLPGLSMSAVKHFLRQETTAVILPGESKELARHMAKRRREHVRINLNHLGEAILGEEEANRRLAIYLEDLQRDDVEYISVKISTIYSQISLLGHQTSLDVLQERLSQLYRCAKNHYFKTADGKLVTKFVNLDMEEYRDLRQTIELFCSVLDQAEFHDLSAGIVLQSYLPDSFSMQQLLTKWAIRRVDKGGAPIKIRIVKGANLAMEKVEASLKSWPQAPYLDKSDVDSNYKRMLAYGCKHDHARAAHIGIASHNLFDISLGMLLRSQNNSEQYVSFEMLEGMADGIRRAVQQLVGSILLYCPAATADEFQNAVAYLVRRLDENTAPDNFLRHLFHLTPNSPSWRRQAKLFTESCQRCQEVSMAPRRSQNRQTEKHHKKNIANSFLNEPDSDWSLYHNVEWISQLLLKQKNARTIDIPAVVDGAVEYTEEQHLGYDPSRPGHLLYRCCQIDETLLNKAIATACISHSAATNNNIIEERCQMLAMVATLMRKQRGALIAAMVAEGGKTVYEADIEVSEAVDFAEYYLRNLQSWHSFKEIQWQPKGAVAVTPPWNFPCSIAAGGIAAALATGNSVLFKPAPEAILVGWLLAKIFWQAGFSMKQLQFIPCRDTPVGSALISNRHIGAVILTGATSTAKLFLKLHPGLDLMAETGGKNSIIVTALADRDLAIKDVIQSAFGHSGQKCSACSLLILEAELYDDAHFLNQLRDAVKSLIVGSSWQLESRVTPLIHPPEEALMHGLTSLDAEETWLLAPKADPNNPNLWSPGIKLGVSQGSLTHVTELFGPVLAIMRAKDLPHAIELANSTPYGLTSGLHSLDVREQKLWLESIIAGNCYINRTITGAIVERQPFGGTKMSSFGPGAKAGGPNYLAQLMIPQEIMLSEALASLEGDSYVLKEKIDDSQALTADQKRIWLHSAMSYAYWWKEFFSKDCHPCQLLGQHNFLRYRPHPLVHIRLADNDSPLDLLLLAAAAHAVRCPIEVSAPAEHPLANIKFPLAITTESDEQFAKRQPKRVRMLSEPTSHLLENLAKTTNCLTIAQPLSFGRLELLHFLREIAISIDHHRYGNINEEKD